MTTDAKSLRGPHALKMIGQQPVRVVLELSGNEPLSGRIQVQEESAEEFTGWLELASRLDRLWEHRAGHPS